MVLEVLEVVLEVSQSVSQLDFLRDLVRQTQMRVFINRDSSWVELGRVGSSRACLGVFINFVGFLIF